MTAAAKHLVAVWDPSRGADVLHAHVALLLDRRRAFLAGDVEDAYVWWGKIRSPRRTQELSHLPQILALDASLGGGATAETHLYLTDYRSLYVAHVGEVTKDDVREEDGPECVPASVYTPDVQCDCWFMLWDLRRLVLDDTPAVIAELRKLRNTAYHDSAVSLYGGMVDLPLLVTRPDGARYFGRDVRDLLTDGKLWAEFDAEHTGVGAMERDLRDNLFGSLAWAGLDPAARVFIATAERVLRDNRDDPAFDFGPVLVNLAKACEVQANDLLRTVASALAPRDRFVSFDGSRSKDMATEGPFSVGQLALIFGGEERVSEAVRRRLSNGRDLAMRLPAVLAELARWRNPAAHSARIGREDAVRLRNTLVGVGEVGLLAELGKARVL